MRLAKSLSGLAVLILIGVSSARAGVTPVLYGRAGQGVVDPVMSAWNPWQSGFQGFGNYITLTSSMLVAGLSNSMPGGVAPFYEFNQGGGTLVKTLKLTKLDPGGDTLLATVSGDSGLFAPIVLTAGDYELASFVTATGGAQYRTRSLDAGAYTITGVTTDSSPKYGANMLAVLTNSSMIRGRAGEGVVDPVVTAWNPWQSGFQGFGNYFTIDKTIVIGGLTDSMGGGVPSLFETNAGAGTINEVLKLYREDGSSTLLKTVNGSSGSFDMMELTPGNYSIQTHITATGGAQFRYRTLVAGAYTMDGVTLDDPSTVFGSNVLAAEVPEPGTLGLLALGTILIARRPRRLA